MKPKMNYEPDNSNWRVARRTYEQTENSHRQKEDPGSYDVYRTNNEKVFDFVENILEIIGSAIKSGLRFLGYALLIIAGFALVVWVIGGIFGILSFGWKNL